MFHHNSALYRPKMNGAIEANNKMSRRFCRKRLIHIRIGVRSFHCIVCLPNFHRTSTRATSFSLAYGVEPILPIKVEIPTLWILMELEPKRAKRVHSRYDQLKGKKFATLCHGQYYKKANLESSMKSIWFSRRFCHSRRIPVKSWNLTMKACIW